MNPNYDADVAILAPLRADGLEQTHVLRAIEGLVAQDYRVLLVDSTGAQGSSPAVTVLPSLVDLLSSDLIAFGQPQAAYRVQVALALRPSASKEYDQLGSVIVANHAALIADSELADPTVSSDEQIQARIHEIACATKAQVSIGVLHRRMATRFEELGLRVLDGEWALGASSRALGCARTQLRGSERIRIGRHMVGHERTWPDEDAAIRRSLPTTSEWDVRIFGSHQRIIRKLGRTPPLWNVFHVHVEQDLDQLDFWVPVEELHPGSPADPAIDEAIAAGLVVILPSAVNGMFGDGALYASPGGLRSIAKALHGNPQRFVRQSQKAMAYAFEHRAEVIVELLRQVGLGERSQCPEVGVSAVPARQVTKRPRVVYVTSNGAGMGHLTRLLGIARAMGDRAETAFVSLSQAAPVVEQFGFPFVYIGSSAETALGAKAWNEYARQRFLEEFELLRPDAVVFDGTWIYNGLARALQESGIPLIWSRRGMWKEEISDKSLQNSSKTIGVIEPGEFAGDYDLGQTRRAQDAYRTDPITILGQEELLPEHEARERLGLLDGEKAVLVTLGAGNLNSIDTSLQLVVHAMRRLAPQWRIFLTSNPIAGGVKAFEEAESVSYYPIVELARAFDATVSAAGYNSYHEWMAARIPTVWLPNHETRTDDQGARARFAGDKGVGVCVSEPDQTSIEAAIAQIVDDSVRNDMRLRLEELALPNGADDAGTRILALIRGQL